MSGGESLWQGPASLIPISESPDPSLLRVQGSAPWRESWEQAQGLALGFGPGAIRAWHGTPHTFDAFASEAIGSGQGAQSYGYGHYVAGAKATAEHYQQELSGQPYWNYNDPDVGVASARDHIRGLDWEKGLPGAQWSTEDLAKYNGLKNLQSISDRFQSPVTLEDIIAEAPPSAAKWIEANRDRLVMQQPGHLLEVHVKPEENELLDWDQQMHEQNPDILKALQNFYTEKYKRPDAIGPNRYQTGEDIYKDLSNRLGGEQQASNALHSMGIPGIKYLDSGSRNLPLGHPDATSNYVIFDPSNLEIRSRDGRELIPVEGDPFAPQR